MTDSPPQPTPADPATTAPARPCQVCSNRGWKTMIKDGPVSLQACTACGFVERVPFTDPRRHEPGSEGFQSTGDAYAHKRASKERRAARRMAALDGVARRVGARPADRPGTDPARFLDVGANLGIMVEAARRRGWVAHGIEPDAPCVATARQWFPGNDFRCAFLEDVDFGDLRFDAIYCSEVIEHVPDANLFTARLAGALRVGGVLYLTTPDISHWRRPRDIRQWDGYCAAHLLHFSPGNLVTLLGKHGFKLLRRRRGLKPGIKLFAQRER